MMAATVASGAFGAGSAAAKGGNYTGQTYEKASEAIANSGSKAVISSVVGDQLPMSDCIVTGANKAGFLDSSGRPQDASVLLDLNCDGSLAAPGKPGISADSAAGRKEKHEIKALAWLAKEPKNCDNNMTWCQTLCTKYADKCAASLKTYIGL
jgi:hypothetical protein